MTSQAVALQLWTVRDSFAGDPDRTLAAVRAAGFAAVELAPLPPGLSSAEVATLLARHGLGVTSIHADLPTAETVSHWAQLARTVACSKLIWHGWPRDPRFDSSAGVREVISACNTAASLARDHGLTFGLHNHWWEFEPVEGVWPIRLFHERLHPDVFWQLDVYWAQTAGADPATVVAELGTRVRSVHLKDGPCVRDQPMTPLGRGKVDVPSVLALTQPTDWVIELDECATDPLEAARESLIYLETRQDTNRLDSP